MRTRTVWAVVALLLLPPAPKNDLISRPCILGVPLTRAVTGGIANVNVPMDRKTVCDPERANELLQPKWRDRKV